MKTDGALHDVRSRIEAGYPLLFLRTNEEDRWERKLTELALETERNLVTWTITRGLQPDVSHASDNPVSATRLLELLSNFPEGHLFLLKDFHPYLTDPVILRRVRDLLPELVRQKKTLLLFGPVMQVPVELEKDSVRIELPLPGYEDLREQFDQTIGELHETAALSLVLDSDNEDRLIKAVMGLTSQEARRAWVRALKGRSRLDDDVFTLLIAEKRTLASGSDLLEFYDLEENVNDIGGLDQLKGWLSKRAEAYTPRAREQGVPLPRGVLLLGVQGCGKSLTARATARLLSFPLMRLDIAALLGAQRGESEKNMRTVLELVESIAPAVLWLDEIEKGFAGVEGDGTGAADATMLRLVGTFLTWMAEVQKPVFVVATANSVENLPPEMLRRGRFDELFFVDLPNFDERKHVLGIHLKKRGWKTEQFDLDDLARRTEGFSGAELEQIIVTALIDAFGKGRVLSQEELEQAWRTTVPLSVTMEDKIFALRNWAQDRCRRATSDSRVTAMLEAERRFDTGQRVVEADHQVPLAPWAQLAAAGQIKAAMVEYIRKGGEVLFWELVRDFQPYLEVTGEQGLASRSNPNTVLWSGMSQPLCELICELVTAKRIYIHPVDLERYKSANQGLRLPVLKEPTDEKIPRAAWLPASLRTAPHPIHSARLSRIGRMKLAGSGDRSA
ncbi:AAA family ATPase [Schlesneria sp. T3-172]|uniref:AAA family ATPase n=1 Tax=Schlesneria sphaerica TaxID=3373610 RepID=UPI0037CB0596